MPKRRRRFSKYWRTPSPSRSYPAMGENKVHMRHTENLGRLRFYLGTVAALEAAMYSVLTPMLPGMTEDLGLSDNQAGLLFSSYLIGALAGSVVGALMLGKLSPRRGLQCALVMMSLGMVTFGAAASYPLALGIRVAMGIGGGIAIVTAMTWSVRLGADAKRGESIAVVMSAGILGTLIGPLIGSAAIVMGRGSVFAVTAALVCLLAFVVPHNHSGDAAGRTDERVGFARLVRGVGLSFSAAGMLLVSFTYGALFVLLPLRLTALGLEEVLTGWVFAGCSAFSALVTLLCGKLSDRVDGRYIQLVGIGATLALLVALAVDSPLWGVIVAAVALIGAALPARLTATSRTLSFEAESYGASAAVCSMLIIAAFTIGEAAGGIVAPVTAGAAGPMAPYVLLAVVSSIFLLGYLRSVTVKRQKSECGPNSLC